MALFELKPSKSYNLGVQAAPDRVQARQYEHGSAPGLAQRAAPRKGAHDLLPRCDAAAPESLGRPSPSLQLLGALCGCTMQRIRQRRKVAEGRRDGLPVASSLAGLRTHIRVSSICRCLMLGNLVSKKSRQARLPEVHRQLIKLA